MRASTPGPAVGTLTGQNIIIEKEAGLVKGDTITILLA